MKGIAGLYAALGGSGWTSDGVAWPDGESEAEASRAAREALGRMLRSKKAGNRQAAKEVYARYFGVGDEGDRALLAKGLRRLRADPEVQRCIRLAEPDPTANLHASAGAGWITVREAARLTGYSEDHLRGWIVRTGRVRSRKIGTAVYVNKSKIKTYARKMRARGYGPQEK